MPRQLTEDEVRTLNEYHTVTTVRCSKEGYFLLVPYVDLVLVRVTRTAKTVRWSVGNSTTIETARIHLAARSMPRLCDLEEYNAIQAAAYAAQQIEHHARVLRATRWEKLSVGALADVIEVLLKHAVSQ